MENETMANLENPKIILSRALKAAHDGDLETVKLEISWALRSLADCDDIRNRLADGIRCPECWYASGGHANDCSHLNTAAEMKD